MRGLSLRHMTLAVTVVGLLASAFAQASGATTFVQSAQGGRFQGHELTLRGAGCSPVTPLTPQTSMSSAGAAWCGCGSAAPVTTLDAAP